jgi:hypothetical protein
MHKCLNGNGFPWAIYFKRKKGQIDVLLLIGIVPLLINDNELMITVNDGLVLKCVMYMVVEACFFLWTEQLSRLNY